MDEIVCKRLSFLMLRSCKKKLTLGFKVFLRPACTCSLELKERQRSVMNFEWINISRLDLDLDLASSQGLLLLMASS